MKSGTIFASLLRLSEIAISFCMVDFCFSILISPLVTYFKLLLHRDNFPTVWLFVFVFSISFLSSTYMKIIVCCFVPCLRHIFLPNSKLQGGIFLEQVLWILQTTVIILRPRLPRRNFRNGCTYVAFHRVKTNYIPSLITYFLLTIRMQRFPAAKMWKIDANTIYFWFR